MTGQPRAIAVVLATVLTAMTPVMPMTTAVHAQPSVPRDPTVRARELYLEGKRNYDLADYPRAIAVWKESYTMSGAPMLLFNIGQAYRLAGDCPQALRFYASYEREAKEPHGPANKDELELAKARCDTSGDPTNANPPDPITPDKPVAPMRVPEPARERDPRPAPMPAPRPRGGTLRVLGIAVAGVGVLLLGGSYYFASRASDREAELEAYVGEWTTAQRDLEESGRGSRSYALGFGVTGALAVIGGATMYALGWQAGRESAVTVAITPHATEVQWHVRF